MKITLVLLTCVVAFATSVPTSSNLKNDKALLQKQKFLLEILHHVQQPLLYQEYLQDGELVEGEQYYSQYSSVVEFLKLWKQGMLPRGNTFSILNEEHLKETVALFDVFYYAKDWTTFYKNVIWARQHINEGMFVYALTVAVAHSDNLVGIILPAAYEILPNMFFNAQVLREAWSWKMQESWKKTDTFSIWANYTSDYYMMNEESKLAYFTEDVGLNLFYWNFHVNNPTWLGGEKFGVNMEGRGEKYLYWHQQLLARYYLERISNSMGDIPELSLFKPISSGYNPMLQYNNGLGMSVRKNWYDISSSDDYLQLNKIDDYERRIRDVIDSGVIRLADGSLIDLQKPESIEILGNIIQNNPDSPQNEYFGYLVIISKLLLGGSNNKDANDRYRYIIPSALEHYETALRDPVFFQLWKRIIKYYWQFKNKLPSYERGDLILPGVKVLNVVVDKLVTYFDIFESEITNAIELGVEQKQLIQTQKGQVQAGPWSFTVKARQYRLNHKAFAVNIDVITDKAQKVVVRLFLGPKNDQYGKLSELYNNGENFVELDKFVYELPVGKSTIVRESKQFLNSVKDKTTYSELYKAVIQALQGNSELSIDESESQLGIPDRLVLPKGWAQGMPMQLFVILSSYVQAQGGAAANEDQRIDYLPLGYPFDREIIEGEWYTPNMYFKDVYIFHRTNEDMANTVREW